jgi:hypothetical protein
MTSEDIQATITACANKLHADGMTDLAAAYRAMVFIALAELEDQHQETEDHAALRRDMHAFAATVGDTLYRWRNAA